MLESSQGRKRRATFLANHDGSWWAWRCCQLSAASQRAASVLVATAASPGLQQACNDCGRLASGAFGSCLPGNYLKRNAAMIIPMEARKVLQAPKRRELLHFVAAKCWASTQHYLGKLADLGLPGGSSSWASVAVARALGPLPHDRGEGRMEEGWTALTPAGRRFFGFATQLLSGLAFAAFGQHS